MSKEKNDEDEKPALNVKRAPIFDSDEEVSNCDARSLKKARYDEEEQVTAGDENAESEIQVSNADQSDGKLRESHSSVGLCIRAGNNNTNPALRRWQSKQLAQSIVDNAINKVLGDLGNTSPVHVTLGFLNPQIIENEGVAVAIRQQGLQRRRYIAALAAAESWDSEATAVANSAADERDASQLRTDNAENKIPSEAERLVHPEDLLNQAVSCAISRKGLASVSQN